MIDCTHHTNKFPVCDSCREKWQDWWGYWHTNGHVQAKRYFNQQDISEANQSPFVQASFGPFRALDRDGAIKRLMKEFNLETNTNIEFDKGI